MTNKKTSNLDSEQIRQLISEEYLRGIPEFVLRQATQKYVDEIRAHVYKHILISKSESESQRDDAMDIANEILEDLEKETYGLLEEHLWEFMNANM